jgi:tRNA1(Val) A37 N6-methylase TrmN6
MPEDDRAASSRTLDRLLGGRVVVEQPRRGYRIAVDPILLAAAVPARPGQRVLDLGTGVGAAALCLMARVPGLSVTGIEVDPDIAEIGRRNAARNGRAEFDVVTAELRALPRGLVRHGYDHVMANPPYLDRRGQPSPLVGRRRATSEDGAPLRRWLDAAGRMAKPRGTITVVHRADRLDDVLAAMAGVAGAAAILPICPEIGRPARRIVVSARCGTRGGVTLLPGLVLHARGRYTDAAEAVLRHAEALPLVGHSGAAAASVEF